MHEDTNGWPEYQRLILAKLETLESGQKEFREDVQDLKVDMAVLKTKAGVWGMVGGAIPVAIGLLVNWFTAGKKQG